ncbi:MAG: SDR family NAD(P)-dependent oxidoreductase [Pelagibacterium sp.]|uniref:SDR family NAD(P)-dependent oxidoreductase n=1 Tax=Pelagibacterium sp. TaxID=1967288 RepID=UPI0032EE909A
MSERKSGKIAIVTGGSSGIGRSIAEQLYEKGCHLVLVDRNPLPEDMLDSLDGSRFDFHQLDLSSESNIKSLIAQVGERHGHIDVLVNSAGIHPKKDGGKPLLKEMATEQWNLVMAVNLTAPFLLIRECLPWMSGRGYGRIVNITSRAGRTLSPIAAADYSASKAGLIALTRVTALEVASEGITANCVAPGPVTTAITTGDASIRESMTKIVPLGRYGRAEEIASAVTFLVSDEASFITGTVLDVNGGSYMT